MHASGAAGAGQCNDLLIGLAIAVTYTAVQHSTEKELLQQQQHHHHHHHLS